MISVYTKLPRDTSVQDDHYEKKKKKTIKGDAGTPTGEIQMRRNNAMAADSLGRQNRTRLWAREACISCSISVVLYIHTHTHAHTMKRR